MLVSGQPLEEPGPEPRVKFARFAREWFDTYVTTNNKPSEQRTKASTLRLHLIPAFGRYRLDAVTPRLIEEFKAQQLQLGLTPKTINNQLHILAKALSTAAEWGLLDHPPRIRHLRAASRVPETLSDEECARLLSDDSDSRCHAMVLLAMRAGLRLGEIIGLCWNDVDFDAGLLVVRQSIVRGIASTPKSGRTRCIPIDAEIARALSGTVWHPKSNLFFARADGQPLTDSTCGFLLDRLCRRVGVRHMGWHALRHTFATQLLEEREPIRNIQQLLGHSTVAMTERYTHVLPDRLRASISALTLRHGRIAEKFGHYVGNDDSDRSLERENQRLSTDHFSAQQSKEHRVSSAL